MKGGIILLLLISLIVLVGCTVEPQAIINGNTIMLEVADTPGEQAKGMMYRENLPEDNGMLFVFKEEKVHGFWMKYTLIPLDMIFINDDLVITKIFEADPCEAEPCPKYDARGMYVLEVNKGYSARHDIKVGDNVVLKGLK